MPTSATVYVKCTCHDDDIGRFTPPLLTPFMTTARVLSHFENKISLVHIISIRVNNFILSPPLFFSSIVPDLVPCRSVKITTHRIPFQDVLVGKTDISNRERSSKCVRERERESERVREREFKRLPFAERPTNFYRALRGTRHPAVTRFVA